MESSAVERVDLSGESEDHRRDPGSRERVGSGEEERVSSSGSPDVEPGAGRSGEGRSAGRDGAGILKTRRLNFFYGPKKALSDVEMDISEKRITAIIGPSGCGKSTLLRTFNRMNEFIPGTRLEGQVFYRGKDLYGKGIDSVEIRRRIGMVFQKPNPFPKSIYQNISWAPGINGFKGDRDDLVRRSLRRAALWDEVKDRLGESALALSGGQQQRLCIARALAMEPEILLMDEPCSALDPASTSRIEDLLLELKVRYTIVIVTHNMQQAARVSDFTAFLDTGVLIEFDETRQLFTRPAEKRTEDYVTGRFG
ncbi:MAG: phosphate ABC transporter ATP-binding protein PstB [Acidobacteriota bacterium]